jgi:hypothetical protein
MHPFIPPPPSNSPPTLPADPPHQHPSQAWSYRDAESEAPILRAIAQVHSRLDTLIGHLKPTNHDIDGVKADPTAETLGAKSELLAKQWEEWKRTVWMGGWLIPATIGLILYSGYVEFSMWWWFGVPIGLPPLTFWQMCGVSLLAGTVVIGSGHMHLAKDPKAAGWTAIANRVVFWTMLWVIGWIIHQIIQVTQ